ncbi:hypothetical protein [Parasedimentitalea marina]|uniref:hypothetical protein n=1 Tax=Parasedimentitalea marina TaxID=2483033 RepID=UPI0013E396D6|nr:hypothetical protein [Parasedimentitalea marina]
MSSLDPTLAQQKLMSSWNGRAIDDRGILRTLNEGGSRPPLLWIFNSAEEPVRFAKALGDDQPLIFSRSSHLLVPPDDDPTEVRNILTEYLFGELKKQFPGSHFDMGTSCQGSGIVMKLSNRLREADISVGHLCIVNCSLPQIDTNLPALLVYGDEDEGHNPFQRDSGAAETRAKMVFSKYRKLVLKTRHGQYYLPENAKEIIAQFDLFRSQPPPAMLQWRRLALLLLGGTKAWRGGY